MKVGEIKQTPTCDYFRLFRLYVFKPSSANPTKWLNTIKQFVGKLPYFGFDT